jgi:hypothetical protein
LGLSDVSGSLGSLIGFGGDAIGPMALKSLKVSTLSALLPLPSLQTSMWPPERPSSG